MLFRNIVLLFLLMIKHHQCQIFRQNTIVFPKIVKRFKRDINAVSNGIQLDIDGQNESENFSLYLKKNANLGYFHCISCQLKNQLPNTMLLQRGDSLVFFFQSATKVSFMHHCTSNWSHSKNLTSLFPLIFSIKTHQFLCIRQT